jgi:uncharacterized protein with PQ loop repeat
LALFWRERFRLMAGSVATAIFMLSQLPMLIKAGRTKDLASYSPLNIVLSNVGNVIYVYVFNLPPGPIWAMHVFYLTATGLMLFWYLRHRKGRSHGMLHGLVNADGDGPNGGPGKLPRL